MCGKRGTEQLTMDQLTARASVSSSCPQEQHWELGWPQVSVQCCCGL